MSARATVDTASVVLGFRNLQARVRVGAAAATRMHGQLLVTRIKANASGRPGPNAPTGDYRRSWNMRLEVGMNGAEALVGTNRPQARRLEYGFHGADSLGRVYNQPSYPHVQPAMDVIKPAYLAAMQALIS